MPIKKSELESTFQSLPIIGAGTDRIKIDDFEFSKKTLSNQPMLTLMLLICIDPTEKQKELLEKLEVFFTDDNKKQVFPKEQEQQDGK